MALAAPGIAGKSKQTTQTSNQTHLPEISRDNTNLPTAVAEMRDAIISAARSGRLEELLIPVQWNELPPDFGAKSVKETFAQWQKQSADGSGREMLAQLINLLEAPHAVIRQGRDVENAKIYIWPAFAELPLTKIPPALHVEFLRLMPASEAKRMITQGYYDGLGLAIGADGTWHAFKKTEKPRK
jgi:hypothetical protein